MASSASAHSPLKKIQEQLTCPVCLDLYDNPRSLPCLHSFCLKCLDQLPGLSDHDKTIACPTCRTITGPCHAANLPAAFHLNNLKEVYILMKKASGSQPVSCDNCGEGNANGYCKDCRQFLCLECVSTHKKWSRFADHTLTSLQDMAASSPQSVRQPTANNDVSLKCSRHDKSFKIFCETCQELVCRDCVVRIHRDHEYDTIAESYDKFCQEIEQSLIAIEGELNASEEFIAAADERKADIEDQGRAIKAEIVDVGNEMISKIQQSMEELIEEVENVTKSKVLVVSSQAKSAQIISALLRDYKEFAEQHLAMDTQQQMLMLKKQITARMNHVMEENKLDQQLLEDNDIQFITHEEHDLSVGLIDYQTDPLLKQCEVQEIAYHDVSFHQESFSFPLSLELQNSTKLNIPLPSLSCHVESSSRSPPINTTITTTDRPGVYEVTCTPIVRGTVRVTVDVDDNLFSATIPVTVPFNHYSDRITPILAIVGLGGPCGVAVSDDGRIFVVENTSNCVKMLNKEGKHIKSFRNDGFFHPRGIALTHDDQHILVTDDHEIQMRNARSARKMASVGGSDPGSNRESFNFPSGVAVSGVTGQIYVADANNHRVQVFNPDLTFSFSFGSKGTKNGDFQRPLFISFDSQHILYVCDRGNFRIQKFSSDGQFLSQFSSPNRSLTPVGLTIDNNILYVSEGNEERISIFTTDGQYLNAIATGFRVEGITCDGKGTLYIADYTNNKLYVC